MITIMFFMIIFLNTSASFSYQNEQKFKISTSFIMMINENFANLILQSCKMKKHFIKLTFNAQNIHGLPAQA